MEVRIVAIFLIVQCRLVLSLDISDLTEDDLYMGQRQEFNTTEADCVTRAWPADRALCYSDVVLILYSGGKSERVNPRDPNWFRKTKTFDPKKRSLCTIHGYAGGYNGTSYSMVRDAIILNNEYNMFVFDYGPLSIPPCYVQLVESFPYIAQCMASIINPLIAAGMPYDKITCMGHSFGCHLCGYLSNLLTFKWYKIIGLDPAAPLIPDNIRLNRNNAYRVHTLETNTGALGALSPIGHVDVCVNGGFNQPYCVNTTSDFACSHFYALCYAAQSLFCEYKQEAHRCRSACPSAAVHASNNATVPVITPRGDQPETILFGLDIPDYVEGQYCLQDPTIPFCPASLGGFGNEHCCSFDQLFEPY